MIGEKQNGGTTGGQAAGKPGQAWVCTFLTQVSLSINLIKDTEMFPKTPHASCRILYVRTLCSSQLVLTLISVLISKFSSISDEPYYLSKKSELFLSLRD